MCLFRLRRVRIHWPTQSFTFYELYINLYFDAPHFTEFKLRKVFEKFYGNRASNNENINKVHDLPGHASYWFKIVTTRNDKYIRMIYELMLRDKELLPTKVNWASLVKKIFMTLGYYEVWVNQGVGDYDIFMLSLKQRFTDNFVQNWHSRLKNRHVQFFLQINSFIPFSTVF